MRNYNMKSEKGVTLTALVIYVVVATVVIGALAIISSYFYSNMGYVKDQTEYVSEYNKFNMFFIQDVKTNQKADVVTDTITFGDGTEYQYKEGKIYRNNEEIATNIKNAMFSLDTYVVKNTTKSVITVSLDIGEKDKSYKKAIEYVLKYW